MARRPANKKTVRTRSNNATESFWNDVTPRYDEEIFNTLTSDVNGALRETITQYAQGVATVGDFGCGIGRFLGLLSGLADEVVAVDFSQKSVDLARTTWAESDHITIDRVDLANASRRFTKVEVGLSINVLVMPDSVKRRAILKNTWRNIRPGGQLILVVPSLESALYTYTRYAEWYERNGASPDAAIRRANREAMSEVQSLAGGIVTIDNTPTKHFLCEEVHVLLEQNRFEPLEAHRVEYAWSEDIESPPRWLKSPLPWDWLMVARRL